MKIIDRAEFLKKPYGTVYTKITENSCSGLCIKQANIGLDDWSFKTVDAYLLTDIGVKTEGFQTFLESLMSAPAGKEYPIDAEISYRDALLQDEARFMVYSKDDLKLVMGLLRLALLAPDNY